MSLLLSAHSSCSSGGSLGWRLLDQGHPRLPSRPREGELPSPSLLTWGWLGHSRKKDSSCFLTGREVWMGGRNGWSLLTLMREKLGGHPDLPFFGREAVTIVDCSRDACEAGITGLIQSRRIFGGQTRGHRMMHSSCLEEQPVQLWVPHHQPGTHNYTQFSSVAQSCLTLWPHGLRHARPPCPSPTPGACSNSCPSRWWCHPTISSSAVPFSSCLQSFPAPGSLPMRQFFASGSKSIGASQLRWFCNKQVPPLSFRLFWTCIFMLKEFCFKMHFISRLWGGSQ